MEIGGEDFSSLVGFVSSEILITLFKEQQEEANILLNAPPKSLLTHLWQALPHLVVLQIMATTSEDQQR